MVKKLQLVDLKYQKIIEQRECYLHFEETALTYVMDFISDEPINWEDPQQGTRECRKFYDITLRRSAINSVDLSLSDGKLWKITISAFGLIEDIRIYFKLRATAQDIYDDLKKYIKQ